MRLGFVIGVLLIVLGFVVLAYQGYLYFTQDRVLDLDSLKIDMAQLRTIVLHPVFGVVALALGVLLVLGSGRRAAP
jgi:hypothetical protein